MSTRETGGTRAHLTFVGDSMLLMIPVGGTLVLTFTNLFGTVGWSGLGLIPGILLTPAVTLLVVMVLRGLEIDRRAWGVMLLATAVVLAIAGGLYMLVVTRSYDQASWFQVSMNRLLVLEGLVAFALLIDGIVDLAGPKANTAMDIIRFISIALVSVALAVLWRNPDFGEFVVALVPLGVAGAVTGLIGDGLLSMGGGAEVSPTSRGPAVTP